jgi:putative ABC transport system permease protein
MTRFQLVLRGVLHPFSRFALTVLVTGCTTAAVFLYLVLAAGIDLSLERERSLLGADLLVIPKGADFEPEETLLAGAPPGITMSSDILGALEQIPEIEAFTPQLYIRSLTLGCCSMKDYPIVGIDPGTDFIITPLLGGRDKARLGNSALIGGCDTARRNVGDKVVFFNHPFRIRRHLPCTGMAVDKTFYMPMDTARAIAGQQLGLKPGDISGVMIRLKDRKHMDYVAEMIEYLMDDARVLRVPVMVRQAGARIRLVQKLLGAGLILLAASGAALLLGVCWLAASARQREAALLRALGATVRGVLALAAAEMLILTALGAALGLALGRAGLFYMQHAWLARVNAPFVFPETAILIKLALAAAGATLAAAFLAGLPPAVRTALADPDAALKDSK